MNMREARQRCALYNMRIQLNDGEYRVTYQELSGKEAEKSAYYTDDIEDAVLTAGSMRRTRQDITAMYNAMLYA